MNPLGEATLVAHWGFVYDYDDDIGGGFVTGEFLLRSDGALLERTGHSSSRPDPSGAWTTTWQFSPWKRSLLWDGGASPDQVKAMLRARGYGLCEPGPVPIDSDRAGPFPGLPDTANWS